MICAVPDPDELCSHLASLALLCGNTEDYLGRALVATAGSLAARHGAFAVSVPAEGSLLFSWVRGSGGLDVQHLGIISARASEPLREIAIRAGMRAADMVGWTGSRCHYALGFSYELERRRPTPFGESAWAKRLLPIWQLALSRYDSPLQSDNDITRHTTLRFGLTPAEDATIRLVARGLTNTEIAHALGLSCNTVRNRLVACFRKLDATRRAEAVFTLMNGTAP